MEAEGVKQNLWEKKLVSTVWDHKVCCYVRNFLTRIWGRQRAGEQATLISSSACLDKLT